MNCCPRRGSCVGWSSAELYGGSTIATSGSRSARQSATKSRSVAPLPSCALANPGHSANIESSLGNLYVRQVRPGRPFRGCSQAPQIGGGLWRKAVFQVVVITSPEWPAIAKIRLGWVEPRNELCQ